MRGYGTNVHFRRNSSQSFAGETRLGGEDRVDCVRGTRGLADLEVPRLKARVQSGYPLHEIPPLVVRKPARHRTGHRLERVDLGGHEQQPVERQLLHGPPGDAQMPRMDGIETPAKNADSRSVFLTNHVVPSV